MSAKRQLTKEDVEKVLDCVFTPLEEDDVYKHYPPGSFESALEKFNKPFMQRYEYKILTVSQLAIEAGQKLLNELGAQGWHLVAELDDSSPTHTLVFERPLPG